MRDPIVLYLLTMLLRRIPMILVAVGGFFLALVRRRFSRRAALMTAIALVTYLISIVVFNAFLFLSPQLTNSWHLSASTREWIDWTVFFCEDLVNAAIIILLTAAAFTERDAAPIAEPS